MNAVVVLQRFVKGDTSGFWFILGFSFQAASSFPCNSQSHCGIVANGNPFAPVALFDGDHERLGLASDTDEKPVTVGVVALPVLERESAQSGVVESQISGSESWDTGPSDSRWRRSLNLL